MKLMPFSIITLGIAIAALILSVGYFQNYAPKTTEAGYWNDHADKLEAEANKLPAMKKKVQEAIEFTTEKNREWQDVVAVKTPADDLRRGGIDLEQSRYQLVVDAITFRNSIQKAMNRQVRAGGVKVIAGPQVPSFPDDPAVIMEQGFSYPSYQFPVKIFHFGAVTVEGTRRQIEENVESWSRMPNYMAVVDGLTYEGTAPTLRATYNLSVLMFLRAKNVYPPVPSGAAPSGPGGNAPGGGNVPPVGRASSADSSRRPGALED